MRKIYIWLFKNLTFSEKDLYMIVYKYLLSEKDLYMIAQEFNIVQKFNV